MVLTSREDSVVVGLYNHHLHYESREITVATMEKTRDFKGYRPTLSTDNKMLFTATNKGEDIGVYNVSHSSLL